MQILLIHQAYLGGEEAGGTRHHELGCLLADRGHNFSVIASTISYLTGKPVEGNVPPQDGKITVHRAYTYPALHRSYLHRAVSFLSFMISAFIEGLRVKEVDLIWGTSPPLFQAFPAWLLARLKGVPFLLEVRDLWPAFAVDMGVLKNRFLIRLAEWGEIFLYRAADQIMINSPGFRAHVEGKGIPREKITLIANGVDLQYFPEQSSGKIFRESNNLEGKFVVLYAGAHGPANDLGVILQAAEQLRTDENLQFVLVGDGKHKSALIQQAEDFNLSNVTFIPAQPKSRMGEILAGADAGIALLQDIPMFNTTYPNKVFDYMAAGIPTILGIDGVIREVIENAEGGIFVQPGDSKAVAEGVMALKDHPQKSKQMGKSARSYVANHFSRQQQAEELEDLLLELKDI